MTQSAHSPSRWPDKIGGLSDARRAAICWHIASGQAGISLLLVFGRGSFGEISAKFATGGGHGEAFVLQIIVRN
jgi:hypothetical protein